MQPFRKTCWNLPCSVTKRGIHPGQQRICPANLNKRRVVRCYWTKFQNAIDPAPAKLLRVLQERELERVGGSRTVKLDVRVICTTNRNLAKKSKRRIPRGFILPGECISAGYSCLTSAQRVISCRWHVIPGKICPDAQAAIRTRLIPAAIEVDGYRWDGNIRELENVIQRALILSSGGQHPASGSDAAIR